MKIAILTQPLRTNYGGILQAYALQTILYNMGHTAVVIRREHSYPSLLTFLMRIGSILKCIVRKYVFRHSRIKIMSPLSPYYHIDDCGFDVLPFVKERINQSPEIRNSKTLAKYFKRNKFDAYVVGSDQVWRPGYSPCITDFFLKEVQHDSKALKIAYAVSFGTDVWEFTNEQTAQCAILAKEFDAVSVREDSAVELCSKYLGIEALHVLDPTMLLDEEHYTSLIDEKNMLSSTLLCYILDNSADKLEVMNVLTQRLALPVSCNSTRRDKNLFFQPSVQDWLKSIKQASFIFTDSFHGCVFSIIFKKTFVVFSNRDRGLARIESLLSKFGLRHRLVSSFDDFMRREDELLTGIDYTLIDKIIQNEKKLSLDFLLNSLSKQHL